MSDLENMWDDYPTGKAPVDAILSAAGGGSSGKKRHHFVTKPVLTAAAATAVIGAFVTGTLVAGGDGGGGAGTPPTGDLPQRVAFRADLPAAESCDDLLATYIERAVPLVSAWGWGAAPYGRAMYDGAVRVDGMAARDQASATSEKARTPQTDRQVNSATGTNVQEAAVDEPDTVKTDGDLLLTVRDDELTTYDVSGPSTEELSTIGLPGIDDAEILLAGDTVIAIGADDSTGDDDGNDPYDHVRPGGTRVIAISMADPSAPEVTSDIAYDASLLSTRQHGADVRIVLSSGLPSFDFVEPNGKRSADKAQRQNRQLVRDSTIEDWLPTITPSSAGNGGEPQQLLDCTDVAIPSDDLTIDTTSVVGFDASDPAKVDAIGLAGQVGIAYESADHLYLATDGGGWAWSARCIDWCDPVGGPGSGVSHVFDFELDGIAATHVASGKVEGSIRDRWSIDEADGVLRLAVGPTSETGNFNSIITLTRDGQRLVEHGRLDGLGRNEDITSVRWFDDLAIIVTFRRVDPLHAVDLTDPSTPRLLGTLKVPGFSSYLHPLGERRMIGIGEGPDGRGGWGAQLGLFDVTDLTVVRRLAVHRYPRATQAVAATDPRAFTWLPAERTALTVIEKWGSRRVGYLSIVRIDHGRLIERLMRVEYGDDVDDVRTVPLPDGRVVLVTGEQAEFLEL